MNINTVSSKVRPMFLGLSIRVVKLAHGVVALELESTAHCGCQLRAVSVLLASDVELEEELLAHGVEQQEKPPLAQPRRAKLLPIQQQLAPEAHLRRNFWIEICQFQAHDKWQAGLDFLNRVLQCVVYNMEVQFLRLFVEMFCCFLKLVNCGSPKHVTEECLQLAGLNPREKSTSSNRSHSWASQQGPERPPEWTPHLDDWKKTLTSFYRLTFLYVESAVPQARQLEARQCCWCSSKPSWINSSCLKHSGPSFLYSNQVAPPG